MNRLKYVYKYYFRFIGIFILMEGALFLVPLILLIFYPQEVSQLSCFLYPSLGAMAIGGVLNLIFRKNSKEPKITLTRLENIVLVVLLWIFGILASAFPFFLTKNFSFSQAVFEAMSGYTTTGFSVCDVDHASHLILFYRSLLHFVGGVGFILIISCVTGNFGMNFFSAEGHTDQLLSNLGRTARIILLFYFSFIAIGSILLIIVGIPVFDAINYSISAVSTGGFATHSTSVLYFNNIYAEIILAALMILGGTPFVIHLSFFSGKIKNCFKDTEMRAYYIILIFFCLIASLLYFQANSNESFWHALRVSSFSVISALTTTGLTNANIAVNNGTSLFPHAIYLIFILCFMIGSCAGSTAGGIKVIRCSIAGKSLVNRVKKSLRNKYVIKVNFYKRNGEDVVLSDEESQSSSTFILVYIIILFLGTLLTSAFFKIFDGEDIPLGYSLLEFANAIGNSGMTVGYINTTTSAPVLWVFIVGMFLGRLEIFVVLQAFAKIFNDIRGKEIL